MKLKRIISRVLCLTEFLCIGMCGMVHAQDAEPTHPRVNATSDSADKTVVLLVRLAACCREMTWPAAENRIQKELSLSNLTVLTTDSGGAKETSLETVLAIALKASTAQGAILVAVTPDAGVHLHTLFYDRETGKLEYRRHPLGSNPTADTVEVAAIKTREVVLAALYEHGSLSFSDDAIQKKPDKSAGTGTEQDKSSVQTSFRAEVSRVQLTAAFGVAWSPGGVGALGIAGGELLVRLSRQFALGVDGWISVPGKKIEAAIGEATVQLIAGRATAALLLRQIGPILPNAGIRLGILNLRSEGRSDTHPVTAVSKFLFFGSVFAEAGFVIAERMVIPISLDIGIIPPGIDILFAGKPEAALKVFILDARIGIKLIL